MLFGPRGSGYHTQAKILQGHYGWRIVDFPKLLKNKMAEIMSIVADGRKPPNNVSKDGPCMICMSEKEL